jgi:REP element-mobilizing transposase RayT
MNLELDEFVVMPNHFHGIIVIGNNQYNSSQPEWAQCRDAMHGVSTNGSDIDNDTNANKFAPQRKNLASIIRGFKSSVTIQAKRMGIYDFAWQTRFHDHIIRDNDEFVRISNYILHNPATWQQDKFYNNE